MALVVVIRPVVGWVALLGCREMTVQERRVTAFFGIRGVGSIYYLAFAAAVGGSAVGLLCGPVAERREQPEHLPVVQLDVPPERTDHVDGEQARTSELRGER